AAGEIDLRLAFALDLADRAPDQAEDVLRLERRTQRRDRDRLGDPRRRGEHRGAAEAVSDEQPGRLVIAPQEIRGGDEIVDVRGEVGVREIAFAAAEPGEVEAQPRDAALRERLADRGRRLALLGAGEAVREQGGGE